MNTGAGAALWTVTEQRSRPWCRWWAARTIRPA